MRIRRLAWVAVPCFLLGALGYWLAMSRADRASATPAADVPAVTRIEGLGAHRMDVSIGDSAARGWFDQGLTLAYAFNHDAAERAFLEAARLEPECAMCWWGAALVLGPHLNAGMDPARAQPALERAHKARELARQGGDLRERAYTEALATRYAPGIPRTDLDQAYAQSMRELVQRFPQDTDARTLLAEALMDLHPWDFHDRSGRPRPWTGEILAVLEQVLREDPDHPGANHLYIHALEAASTPARALASAQRLETLVPGAGHLVHMPSHIYLRVGRYHEASQSNLRAIAADQRYLELCRSASGVYVQGYVPHNHHFLYASSMMEGHSGRAITAADEVSRRIGLERSRAPGYAALQHYWAVRYLVRVRFGRWSELLQEAPPPADLPYPTALWHYARGMALLRQGQVRDAELALQGLATIAAHPDMARESVWDLYRFAQILHIAERQFAGELAASKGDFTAAVAALREAVDQQDRLAYDEPAPWYMPVRQALGAVLLQAGRANEAQAVYEEDLRRHPRNGWSLRGRIEALGAQRRPVQEARADFEAAWKHADVPLDSSRF